MKRRAFLKVLGLSALAPKVAIEVISTAKPKEVVQAIYGPSKITFDPINYGVVPLTSRGVSGDNLLCGDEECLTFKRRDQ